LETSTYTGSLLPELIELVHLRYKLLDKPTNKLLLLLFLLLLLLLLLLLPQSPIEKLR